MFITLEKTNKKPLPRFPVGTKLKCIFGIEFVDGTKHMEAGRHIVTEENQAYFSCMRDYYEVSE